jgi:hypothetical protein
MRIALILLLVWGAPAAIVDRVEIAVGNKVITQSDIEQRIRLTAFENREKPDFSLATRREMAQKLVEQRLIEREMEVGHYPRIGAPPVDEMMAEFEKKNFPDHAAMLAELAKYGLTEADLRKDFAREADLLTFLNLRFRPSGDTTDLAGANQRADKEMDAWLADQRNRTKIDYPDAELAPSSAEPAK